MRHDEAEDNRMDRGGAAGGAFAGDGSGRAGRGDGAGQPQRGVDVLGGVHGVLHAGGIRDGVDRVQGGHGLLEYHGNFCAIKFNSPV